VSYLSSLGLFAWALVSYSCHLRTRVFPPMLIPRRISFWRQHIRFAVWLSAQRRRGRRVIVSGFLIEGRSGEGGWELFWGARDQVPRDQRRGRTDSLAWEGSYSSLYVKNECCKNGIPMRYLLTGRAARGILRVVPNCSGLNKYFMLSLL